MTMRIIKRNVFLTNDEKHVKLADLGISRNLKDKTASLRSTFCGTLLYMSPEMSQHKDYSFNTDVWYLEMIDFF
jgi:serine/threonine protein kinase